MAELSITALVQLRE